MEKMFLTVLNMSITASAVIIVVLLARLALRKAPKVFSYALWAVVLFRLLCPVTIKSNLSIISYYPDIKSVSVETDNAAVSIAAGDNLSPVLPQGQGSLKIPAFRNWTLTASGLWLAGTAAMLGHSIWSMVKLRRKLTAFVQLKGENDVRLVDHIPSPFVSGLFSPKIYLPSSLSESERDYILFHERTHIRRLDHISRALAWLALSVHWFNPLVWLAFCLAGKDMEMSCDEAVLRKMGWRRIQTDYSTSLLRLSAGGKLAAGPLAFGGGDVKRRIENILNYRKPALWVPAAALAVVLTVGAALATDSNRLIEPSDVSSVIVSSIIFESNQEDMSGTPATFYTLSKEDGNKLVRLINSYHKEVYEPYERRSTTKLDDPWGTGDFARIDCTNGFYIFQYRHCRTGEYDYITLLTYWDNAGHAGTTWQMEYNFNRNCLGIRYAG